MLAQDKGRTIYLITETNILLREKKGGPSSLLKSKLGYIHGEQASSYGLQQDKNTSLHWWLHQSLCTFIETVGVGWLSGRCVFYKTDLATALRNRPGSVVQVSDWASQDETTNWWLGYYLVFIISKLIQNFIIKIWNVRRGFALQASNCCHAFIIWKGLPSQGRVQDRVCSVHQVRPDSNQSLLSIAVIFWAYHVTANISDCSPEWWYTHGYQIRCIQGWGGGGPAVKRSLWRPRRTYVKNIRTDIDEIGWEGIDWIDLAQDWEQWRALLYAVVNLYVLQNVQNFLNNWWTVNFWWRPMPQRCEWEWVSEWVSYIYTYTHIHTHKHKHKTCWHFNMRFLKTDFVKHV